MLCMLLNRYIIQTLLDNNNVTNNKYTMQKIKQLNSSTIKLDNIIYKGYTVGDLPKTFAFIYNEDKDQDGITKWFNFKGLTYVSK